MAIDSLSQVHLLEPPPQVRQVIAHHYVGLLFPRREGTIRGAENHGAGTRMGALSRDSPRHKYGKRARITRQPQGKVDASDEGL